MGGFGSAVMEAWAAENLPPTRFLRLGIRDHFVEHGDRKTILARLGLDAEGIARSVEEFAKSAHALLPRRRSKRAVTHTALG